MIEHTVGGAKTDCPWCAASIVDPRQLELVPLAPKESGCCGACGGFWVVTDESALRQMESAEARALPQETRLRLVHAYHVWLKKRDQQRREQLSQTPQRRQRTRRFE